MSKAPITINAEPDGPLAKTPEELEQEEKRLQDLFLLLETMYL